MNSRDIKPENVDLAAIRARAEKAIPGPWEVHRYDCNGGAINWQVQQESGASGGMEEGVADVITNIRDDECNRARGTAAHIAGLSPDVVLALLDRLEAAERERDETRAVADRQLSAATIAQGRAEGEAEGLRLEVVRLQGTIDRLTRDGKRRKSWLEGAAEHERDEACEEVRRLTRELAGARASLAIVATPVEGVWRWRGDKPTRQAARG